MELTPEQEVELQERDDRVQEQLKTALDYKLSLARQLRKESDNLLKEAREIRQAVEKQHWWKLERLLYAEDIESLCNISPTLSFMNDEE